MNVKINRTDLFCISDSVTLSISISMPFILQYDAVTVCLPLPLSPHPYMVLPVSQSLLVQSVSALCLDYVPGVSSYVSLYKSVLPHVTCGLLLMSIEFMFPCCLDVLPRVPVSPPFVIH